jgi:hypothetical protein
MGQFYLDTGACPLAEEHTIRLQVDIKMKMDILRFCERFVGINKQAEAEAV